MIKPGKTMKTNPLQTKNHHASEASLKARAFGGSIVLLAAGIFSAVSPAQAVELNWAGSFRAEFNSISNYTMDSSDGGQDLDAARYAREGYYIPGGGSNSAKFETLFLKLRPRLVVNDNVYIKSEWWLGDPTYGFYGNAAPNSGNDQKYFNSTYSRGSSITAQRVWGEFLTDIGTFQLGRAPLHWGLGVVWNQGDSVWDHYASTGDVARLISKFGSFTFIPGFIMYSTGNSLGGACTYSSSATGCVPTRGTGAVVDYSLVFKYDNPDEDFEAGVNFIRRLGGRSQDSSGFTGPTASGGVTQSNYNTWDLYGKKRLGKWTFGTEIPLVNGQVGGLDYKTYAIATEADWKISNSWNAFIRAGHAPGQPSGPQVMDKYRAFYFHPNYQLGMVMFHYQLANLGGYGGTQGAANTQNNPAVPSSGLLSPYDNPIVNANYLGFGGSYKTDKWDFHAGFIFAKASETAKSGQHFFNTWRRRQSSVTAIQDQSDSLGWEMDYGTTFQWDDHFQLKLDAGFYFPGKYYEFSNLASKSNRTSMVFGTSAKFGVVF